MRTFKLAFKRKINTPFLNETPNSFVRFKTYKSYDNI